MTEHEHADRVGVRGNNAQHLSFQTKQQSDLDNDVVDDMVKLILGE